MNRRESDIPQTPVHNDDALEKSIRRQMSWSRGSTSITDIARRVQESPLTSETSSRSRNRRNNTSVNSIPPIGLPQPGGAIVREVDYHEWMKMVRQKRIKSTNAFTIQLIDAFHSMVQGHLLSNGGEGVSFQEATHTLGGCLTVYKNRIARVKDDTSKLLVGVTEKKPRSADSDDESDDENEHSDDEHSPRKKKQKTKKIHPEGKDAFLLPASKLEIDTDELKTAIGPLLRKMSADFDKRGAGALLQYSLKPDANGRLLLDAETQEDGVEKEQVSSRSERMRARSSVRNSLPDIIEEEEEDEQEGETDREQQENDRSSTTAQASHGDSDASNDDTQATEQSQNMLLAHFNLNYFSNFDIASRETLPAVDGISRAVANPKEGTDALVREMQAWSLANPEDSSTYAGIEDDNGNQEFGNQELESHEDNVNPEDFDDQNIAQEFGFDNNEMNMSFDDPANDEEDLETSFANLSIASIVSSRLPVDGNWQDVNYLRQLDDQTTNWAGPSFWKIQRLHKKGPEEASNQRSARRLAAAPPSFIDFSDETEIDLQELFATSSRSINLPVSKQNAMQYVLPVDMHVTTKDLTSLYLLPNAGAAPAFKSGAWNAGRALVGSDDRERSLNYDETAGDITSPHHGDYDGAGVDDAGDDNFYYETWDNDPKPLTAAELFTTYQQSTYGSQSNQLNFARVAKRVDVRRLKENVWRGIARAKEACAGGSETHERNSVEPTGSDSANPDSASSDPTTSIPEGQPEVPDHPSEGSTDLMSIIQDTQPLYTEAQRADLSPAMYFISLLHLSNEKGLSLQNTPNYNNINIRF